MAEYFSFYISWRNAIKDLPDDVRLEVYEAAIEYAATGTRPALKSLAGVAFNFIKDDIDRQMQRSQDLSNKRKEAVQQRWQKKQADTNDTKNTNVSFVLQADTNGSNNNKNNNKNKNENKNSLCGGETAERENLFDEIFYELFLLNRKDPMSEARRLYDYYSSQGWCKSGGQKVTDIPALVRQWKCKDDAARLYPDVHSFLVEFVNSAEAEQRPALAMAFRDGCVKDGRFEIVCTQYFVDYVERKENTPILQQIFRKHFPNTEWKYKKIVTI